MVYVWMFLPAICSAVALAISLAYGWEKSALVIAAVAAMSVFLLVKDTLPLPACVNGVAAAFALTYLAISIYLAVKKRRERDAKC
ncbi:hypothetical protein [Emergencia timonensis]|uniref:hypothetical protein n=1 Tax=Emergencia timonensis TaxID=1776384 RepID=UPI003995D572